MFPEAEHRECMFHLVTNFKKYRGKVFDDHLSAGAYSWHPHFFEKHWSEMEQAKSAATEYLRNWCKMLWTRSQFSSRCKVDYVTNNLAESFNNWIKRYKSMNLDDLMDKIRQVLMVKWNQRRKVAMKLEGSILPHIIKKWNERSRDLDMDVLECSSEVGEVSVLSGSGFRCVVNLQGRPAPVENGRFVASLASMLLLLSHRWPMYHLRTMWTPIILYKYLELHMIT